MLIKSSGQCRQSMGIHMGDNIENIDNIENKWEIKYIYIIKW